MARTRSRPRWQDRAADTPDGRLAVSHDRLRAGLAHLSRPVRDAGLRARARAFAAGVADDAARSLAAFAERVETWKDGDGS